MNNSNSSTTLLTIILKSMPCWYIRPKDLKASYSQDHLPPSQQWRHPWKYTNMFPMLVMIYFSHCMNTQTSVFSSSSFSLSYFILCRGKRAIDCNKITNYMLEETRLFFFPVAVIWCCGEQRQRAGVMWHSLCPLSSLVAVYPSQLKVACALHPLLLPEKPHWHRRT